MKKLTSIILAVLTAVILFAQAPQAFKYQAVVRDSGGDIANNQDVSFRISILKGSIVGYSVYTETHDTVTNQFGIVIFDIGRGDVATGVFNNIKWGEDAYFIQVEIDESGGTNYQYMNKNQLITVPYAMNASSLTLTDENGNSYTVGVDTAGNLITNLIYEWTTCGDILTDLRDGKKYKTVLIGSQCWMAENVNVGTKLNLGFASDNDTIEKYCYNNIEDSCDIWGGLYPWDEMMQYSNTPGVQGICPDGWHLPADTEWTTLTDYLGGEYVSGYKMKETGTRHWFAGNSGTNESGFLGFGGGISDAPDTSVYMFIWGFYWSSTENLATNAWYRGLGYDYDDIYRGYEIKIAGMSVRCIKD